METEAIEVSGPLDLRRTLRPLGGTVDADGWWRGFRTPSGEVTLNLHRRRPEILEARAWGRGAEWALGMLTAISGLDDDPAGFATEDPIIHHLHRRHQGWRFARTGLVLDALVEAVVAQKVTSTEAKRSMRGLQRAFSESAPGPKKGLRLPPDPEQLAAAPYYRLHEVGIEKARADILRRVSSNRLRIEAMGDDVTATVAERLASVRGVGRWTIAKTLAISHGDPDQVAVGDFHHKHIVVYHLTGRPRGTDEEMLQLLEPFRPHRGRVVRLLHTLGHEPAFGPRVEARDIRGI